MFLQYILNTFSPEQITLYLMLGLAVAWAKTSEMKLTFSKDAKIKFVQIIASIVVGVLLGLGVMAIFPVYFFGRLYHYLGKNN